MFIAVDASIVCGSMEACGGVCVGVRERELMLASCLYDATNQNGTGD